MPQRVRQESVDFRTRASAERGEGESKLFCNARDYRSPILDELIVGHEATRSAAAIALRKQEMVEPQKSSTLLFDAVCGGERSRDLERIPYREDVARRDFQPREHSRPEWNEPTYPRILDDEERGVSVLVANDACHSLDERIGLGGFLPSAWQRREVIPRRSGGFQQLFVQPIDRLRFEEAALIQRGCAHQSARERRPAETEHAGERRGAAAVHSEHQNRAAPGLRGVCERGPRRAPLRTRGLRSLRAHRI